MTEQLLASHPFQEIADRPGAQRLEQILLVVVRAEQHNLRLGVRLDEASAQIQAAVGATQPHIGHHEVRTVGRDLAFRLLRVHRLPDHTDSSGETCQQRFEPFEHHLVVVDEYNPQRSVSHSRELTLGLYS